MATGKIESVPDEACDEDPEEIEEERRLCYVGITRAKKTLHLSCARTRMRNGERQLNPVSRFAREIPKDLLNGKVPERKGFRYQDDDDLPFTDEYPYSGQVSPYASAAPRQKPRRAVRFNFDDYVKKGSEMGGTAPDYTAGDRVSHVKFGNGTVLSVTEREGDHDVSVDFEKYGIRKLRASFGKLKKI